MCTQLDPARPDPWGAYRDHVEGRLASCADFLSRLTRSLAGEIADDRHYFAEKARCLRDAAAALVAGCTDVDQWMGQCGMEFAIDERLDLWSVCVLPAGHSGRHDDTEGRSATESAYRRTVQVIEAAQQAADVLGALPWGGEDERPDAERLGALSSASSDVLRAASLAQAVAGRLAVLRSPGR